MSKNRSYKSSYLYFSIYFFNTIEIKYILEYSNHSQYSCHSWYINLFIKNYYTYKGTLEGVTEIDQKGIIAIWSFLDSLYICNCFETKTRINPIPKEDSIKEIHKDNIVGFGCNGEVRRYQKIEGGGISIGGAIAGTIIAGPVGVIWAGRKKIETKDVVEDSREVILDIEDYDSREINRINILLVEFYRIIKNIMILWVNMKILI